MRKLLFPLIIGIGGIAVLLWLGFWQLDRLEWKEGVLAALGMDIQPGIFWGRVLAAVGTYRDLATPLVNAVEQLIDFVTAAD